MGKIKGIRKLDLTGLNAVDDGKGKVTISLGSSAGAAISIAEGGTGQTTAAAAANALLNTGMTGNALTIGDSGDTITVGDLKVSGGNIKDTGDNQSIQLPGSGNVRTVADLEVAGNDITLGNQDAASTISHTDQNSDNTGGQNMTIKASAGKGNGVGGSIIFQTAKAPGGYGASTQGVHASALTLDQDGDATIANDCVVGGDVVLTGGIKTNGDLLLRIDDNADGANKFTFENGADTEVAQIDESGNLQVDGSLTVGSNIIKASDGGSTITMDTDDNVTILGDLTVNGNDINFDADDSFIKVGDSATNAPGNRLNLYAGSPETGTHADIAGGDLRLYCGKSKGTATGGNFAVYVTPSAGSPSVALNSHEIALLTRYDKSTTFYGDPILQTNQIKASDSTVAITIDTDGNVVSGGYLKPGTSLYMSKINSAQADIGNHGQLWVKNVSPVELWFTEAGGTDIQITSGTSLASNTIQVASITINESDMNALHTTEQTIVAAQGANKIIMPTSGFLIIDRDSVTSQSSSTSDLFISYDGATSLSEVIYYQRRFMYGESGDRVLHLQHYTGETAQAIADAENKPLTVKLDSAITSGSIDSMKVVISYHVFDNS